jgi:hypothetical protein
MHLGDNTAAAQHSPGGGEGRIGIAVTQNRTIPGFRNTILCTSQNPWLAQFRKSPAKIDDSFGIGIWSGCVIHPNGRIILHRSVQP